MDSLVIKVDSIEKPRQEFRRPLTRAWLEETLAEVPRWSLRAPSELVANLTKVNSGNVLLEGSTSVEVKSACRRCLRDVESTLPVSFTLSLIARKGKGAGASEEGEDDGEGERGATFGDDEVDQEPFDGEKIDLGPLVREQVILALPAAEPLCQDACKGLCTTCGQDLNERDCGHEQKPPDPRWNALKQIKLN